MLAKTGTQETVHCKNLALMISLGILVNVERQLFVTMFPMCFLCVYMGGKLIKRDREIISSMEKMRLKGEVSLGFSYLLLKMMKLDFQSAAK